MKAAAKKRSVLKMRKSLLFLFLVIFAIGGAAQSGPPAFDLSNYGVRIEADKRLIVVLATLEMAVSTDEAGKTAKLINTPLSAQGEKFRSQLVADNSGLPSDLRLKITSFVTQYKRQRPKATDAELVSPFISMAYTLSPAPEFADPAVTSDLPGSLLDVLDFAPLVREFYRRSGISAKLDDYAKMYRAEADGVLRNSAREMVSDLLDYLHTKPELFYSEKIKVETAKGNSKKVTLQKTEIRDRERRFLIVPEMLSPSDSVNFLNIKDDYFVVLPPDKDLSFSGARRAFLQFVVDPMVLKNSKEIIGVKDGIKALLDERRKTDQTITTDVFLTVSRSLIAAIDARQEEYFKGAIATDQARIKIAAVKNDPERLAISSELNKYKGTLADETALRLSEDYERGAVLAFYFAEQLEGTEDSGFDIASSMREMIATFDAAKETDRLTKSADARKRALTARADRKERPTTIAVADNPVTVKLLEIQKSVEAKNFVKADSDLKLLLRENPDDVRIYYNLGRVASLSAEGISDQDAQAAKLLEAQTFYGNALRKATAKTDPALISVTYVAIARLYEFFNQDNMAVQAYDRAIQIGDVKDGAYRDAMTGKQNLLKKQQ